MTVNRRELERLLVAQRERISAELELALDALAAELRAELEQGIADVTRRIDKVHRSALRALTERIQKGS